MAAKDLNATYQILEKHLVHGDLRPGEEIGVRADQFLMQDGTGTMVFLHLSKLGPPRIKGKLAICYVDHNTFGDGPENADDHRFLQDSCASAGIRFSRPSNGIGHQIHLERFGAPGKLLLGADSHVTTLGGLGMLAIGTGGMELAVALTGTPHYFVCPRVIRVQLNGSLSSWVSAKDIILEVIRRLADRSNVATALEYAGDGVKTLSVAQRATITNMGAELGVTSSLFPADEVTRSFLTTQSRGSQYHRVQAGKEAAYDEQIEIDLDKLVPMVALPHSPDKVVPVREVSGLEVDQVAVGSCTNGFYEDLAMVALMLRGRKLSPRINMVMAPGTRQVQMALLARGYLKEMMDMGERIAESACGFCIGHGHAPASGSVSVRTNNRNYEGRCGTLDAKVYLTSPETAAASALRGKLTDPRDLKRRPPRFTAMKKFPIDDSLIVPVPRSKKSVVIRRGPNIVDPPEHTMLPASIQGAITLKLGDHISTDHILPAGHWLKFRSNVQEYAWHTFKGVDPKFVRRAKEYQAEGTANVIIAGQGYGEGSSREHAAMCPAELGVRVIIAKSFERIHISNLINHGIVPLTFMDLRAYELIQKDDDLELPWIANELKRSSVVTARSHDKGYEIKVKHGLGRRQVDILLAGGLRNYVAG